MNRPERPKGLANGRKRLRLFVALTSSVSHASTHFQEHAAAPASIGWLRSDTNSHKPDSHKPMNWWQRIRAACQALFRKEKLDSEMDEEMRAHIELHTQANLAAGMGPDEARRNALRTFGGIDQVKAGNTWSWSRQFNTLFLRGFAFVAFLLASIGVYGITAYSVAQRTREIGIRMALGAQRKNVLGLVLKQGLKLAIAGLAIGVAAALGLARVVSSLLFGITPTDPATFGLVALLVGVVAFAACWFPARRAARLDPMLALRYE